MLSGLEGGGFTFGSRGYFILSPSGLQNRSVRQVIPKKNLLKGFLPDCHSFPRTYLLRMAIGWVEVQTLSLRRDPLQGAQSVVSSAWSLNRDTSLLNNVTFIAVEPRSLRLSVGQQTRRLIFSGLGDWPERYSCPLETPGSKKHLTQRFFKGCISTTQTRFPEKRSKTSELTLALLDYS